MDTIEVPGARLAARRWPGEGPRVVLLHAGVGDLRSWEEVAPALGDADVLAYDRRGHGSTVFDGTPFSHLEDLEAVLGEDPAVLVGSSMGGALAIAAALELADRVTGLVLLAPAVYGQPDPEVLDAPTAALVARLESTEDVGEAARLCAHLWLDGPAQPEGRVTGASRDLAIDMCARVFTHGLEDEDGDPQVDGWSRLEEIGVPVTVACGELDTPFAIETARAVAARTGARHQLIAGTAHLPYLERPEAVAGLLKSAL